MSLCFCVCVCVQEPSRNRPPPPEQRDQRQLAEQLHVYGSAYRSQQGLHGRSEGTDRALCRRQPAGTHGPFGMIMRVLKVTKQLTLSAL